jgi:hypothetical protein
LNNEGIAYAFLNKLVFNSLGFNQSIHWPKYEIPWGVKIVVWKRTNKSLHYFTRPFWSRHIG